VQVTFADGSSTELQIHRTTAADPLVVLCLPAMGVRAKYYEKLAHTLTVPALFINFPGDNYAPAACASYLASKLRSAHVTLRSLSAAHLGIARSDHFRWAAQPQALVRDAVKWIHTHTGPR